MNASTLSVPAKKRKATNTLVPCGKDRNDANRKVLTVNVNLMTLKSARDSFPHDESLLERSEFSTDKKKLDYGTNNSRSVANLQTAYNTQMT